MSEAAKVNADGRGALAAGFLSAIALVVLGVAIALPRLRSANGRGRAALGALLLSDAGSAHNWLNSPRSRTPKLSMTNPCPQRQRFNYPDIQVNRGQPFMVEWQVGHPRTYNFFIDFRLNI